MIVKYLLLLLPTLACALSKGGGSNSAKPWPKFPCQKKVGSEIKVGDGQTFDGGGCEYLWTGKYADRCDAKKEYSENVPKMFRLGRGATLKNVGIRCSPDGVQMGTNSKLENVDIHVEEDGANLSGVNNVTFKNVRFYEAQDKALQVNPGTGSILCDKCEFHNVNVAIKYDGNSVVTVKNSVFRTVDYGPRATKSPGKINVSGSEFVDVGCAFREEGGGKVHDAGGNSFKSVKKMRCK